MRNVLAATVLATLLAGTALGATDADDGERAEIRNASDALLQRFYATRPRLRSEVQGASGHALFTTHGSNLLGEPSEGGRGSGIARRGDAETFMAMRQVASAPQEALGRELLIVFTSPGAFASFAQQGWKPTGSETTIAETKVYRLNGSQVEVGASLAGSSFWNNRLLN